MVKERRKWNDEKRKRSKRIYEEMKENVKKDIEQNVQEKKKVK